jgi:ATP-dependent DNA ligase
MSMMSTHEAFNHKDWLFELKCDGFRTLAYCDGLHVTRRSKNKQSFNAKLQAIKTELERLGIDAILWLRIFHYYSQIKNFAKIIDQCDGKCTLKK